MELRHLKYFQMAAEEMHFGRAADKLNISQPALSKQIRELEEELGLNLFVRLKKSVELTEAGKVFLEETQKTLQQAQNAIYKARLVRKGDFGELKIGYDPSVLPNLLTPILHEVKKTSPGLKVSLKEGCNLTLVELLMEDKLDLVFMFGPVFLPELSYEPIYEEELVLAIPAGHALEFRESISITELMDESFIFHSREESPVKYDQLVSIFQNAGFTPKIMQESASWQTRVSMVASGMGVSFVVESLANTGYPGVVFVPFKEKLPKLQLIVTWKRSKMRPVLRQILKLVPEYASIKNGKIVLI